MGNHEFDIKYWSNGKDENMMIKRVEVKVPQGLSPEQLTAELYIAVRNKDFAKAQLILAELNKTKKA